MNQQSQSAWNGMEHPFRLPTSPLTMVPVQTNLTQSFDNVALARDSLSTNYNLCPTKRIRYTEHNFIERNTNLEEISDSRQNFHHNRTSKEEQNFIENIQDKRIPRFYRQWSHMEEIKYMKTLQHQQESSFDRFSQDHTFEGLTIPPLVVESKASSILGLQKLLKNKRPLEQMINWFQYWSMLVTLRRAEDALSQERLEFFRHQHHQFLQQKSQLADLHQIYPSPISGPEIQENDTILRQKAPSVSVKLNKKLIKQSLTKEGLVSNRRENIKAQTDELMETDIFSHKIDVRAENASQKSENIKVNAPRSFPPKEKKRANKGYPFDINVQSKKQKAPRKKNIWQLKNQEAVKQIPSVLNEAPKISSKIETNTGPISEQIQLKGGKSKHQGLVDIPVHLQYDNRNDFNRLLSITLSNNHKNAHPTTGQSFDFSLVYKNFKTGQMGEVAEETRIGEQYQAQIPKVTKQKAKANQRCLELTWRPDFLNERELKHYLSDLSKILKCKYIHEERALKILKRKKFKKEKVKVNIFKNKKFYSSLLTMENQTDEAVETREAEINVIS